jgi:hypothetical protein
VVELFELPLRPLVTVEQSDLMVDAIFEKHLEEHLLVGWELLELLDQRLLVLHVSSYLDFMMMVKRNRETNKNLPVSNNKTIAIVRMDLIMKDRN